MNLHNRNGKKDTDIIEIARLTYAQRMHEFERRRGSSPVTRASLFMTKSLIFVVPFAVAWLGGVAMAPVPLFIVMGIIVFWPNDDDDAPSCDEAPSFDMHGQDVAHRLSYGCFHTQQNAR